MRAVSDPEWVPTGTKPASGAPTATMAGDTIVVVVAGRVVVGATVVVGAAVVVGRAAVVVGRAAVVGAAVTAVVVAGARVVGAPPWCRRRARPTEPPWPSRRRGAASLPRR